MATANATNNLEAHIRQTQERLMCIQRTLGDPESFKVAATELLEWCSDVRAFQPCFEQGLMNCLSVSTVRTPCMVGVLCYTRISVHRHAMHLIASVRLWASHDVWDVFKFQIHCGMFVPTANSLNLNPRQEQ